MRRRERIRRAAPRTPEEERARDVVIARLEAVEAAEREALDEPGEGGRFARFESSRGRAVTELAEIPGARRALVWVLWSRAALARHAAWILGRLGPSEEIGEELAAFARTRVDFETCWTAYGSLVRVAPGRALAVARERPGSPVSLELGVRLSKAGVPAAFDLLAPHRPPAALRARWLDALVSLDAERARDVFLELLERPSDLRDIHLLRAVASTPRPPPERLVERLHAAGAAPGLLRDVVERTLRRLGAPVPAWPERPRRRVPSARPRARPRVAARGQAPDPADGLREWLASHPRRDALRSWMRALRVFRVRRPVPLMAATDAEQLVCAVRAEGEEARRAVASRLGVRLEAGWQTVLGERVHVEPTPDRVALSVFDGFELDDAAFERARRLERALPGGLELVDPPGDERLCFTPSTLPELFGVE